MPIDTTAGLSLLLVHIKIRLIDKWPNVLVLISQRIHFTFFVMRISSASIWPSGKMVLGEGRPSDAFKVLPQGGWPLQKICPDSTPWLTTTDEFTCDLSHENSLGFYNKSQL